MAILYVFIGGGLGSLARYGIAHYMKSDDFQFPYATLIANFLACIVLGVLMAFAQKNQMDDATRLTFMVGFCGGFSTFSTFSSETFKLLEQGNSLYAIANILGSILICLLGIYIGLRLGK